MNTIQWGELSEKEIANRKAYWLERVKAFKGKKVLVVGDLGLDEYVHGEVTRLSQEAPVPVLSVSYEEYRIGLSGNVAQNVSSLGGQVFLLSLIGTDSVGEKLISILKQQKVSVDHLVYTNDRPTICKTRYMTGPHHIVRVDKENKSFISQDLVEVFKQNFLKIIDSIDIVILEDYAKGVLTKELCQFVITKSNQLGKKVLVDPHPSTPLEFYSQASLLTPNLAEAKELCGYSGDRIHSKQKEIEVLGDIITEKIMTDQVVITRGKDGMSLYNRKQKQMISIPTFAKQVFDVTGAGDTVIATLALSIASDCDAVESCILANYAAGVAVSKIGSVACSIEELNQSILSLG